MVAISGVLRWLRCPADIRCKFKCFIMTYKTSVNMEISWGTLLALGKKFKKSIFLFSGDTEIFITYISYLGLATGQFMLIHNILCFRYGIYNISCVKNSTFTEYEFAFILLHSAKLNF